MSSSMEPRVYDDRPKEVVSLATPISDVAPDSPGGSTRIVRRRRRKALSCNICREKKVKCDREQPCSRCIKGGHPAQCVYSSSPPRSPHIARPPPPSQQHHQHHDHHYQQHHASSGGEGGGRPRASNAPRHSDGYSVDDTPARLVSQTKRISQLENQIASLTASTRPSGAGVHVESAADLFKNNRRDPDEAEARFFRGKGFATQYFGPSNPISMVSFFPEVRSLLRSAGDSDPSVKGVMKEYKPLKARFKRELENFVASKPDLFELLPERSMADSLVKLYFDTYEHTYRILHVPTFWREYQSLWGYAQDRREDTCVIALLVIAAVGCMVTPQDAVFFADASSSRSLAMKYVKAAEVWLEGQSQKHMTLAQCQIRILICIVKQANHVKRKRRWTEVGDVLRFLMSAGFHRDPEKLHLRATPYEKEMRRRIWTSIVELELETSFQRGMMSATQGIACDVREPANIDDEEFGPDSEQLPPSRPIREYTSTSYLRASCRSISLRISLNSVINDQTVQLEYDDVLLLEEKLKAQLDAIPKWAESKSVQANLETSSILTQTLLDIQLRQFLIPLHSNFARRIEQHSRCSYSRMALFDAACSIINQHAALAGFGVQMLNLSRTDIYTSGIVLCQVVHTSSLIPNDGFFNVWNASYPQTIEKALQLLETRLFLIGEGMWHYSIVAGSYAVVRGGQGPDQLPQLKREILSRFSGFCYKILNAQDPTFVENAKRDAENEASSATVPKNGTSSVHGLLNSPPISNAASVPDLSDDFTYNFGDANLSDWTALDNIWTFNFLDAA